MISRIRITHSINVDLCNQFYSQRFGAVDLGAATGPGEVFVTSGFKQGGLQDGGVRVEQQLDEVQGICGEGNIAETMIFILLWD